MGLFSWLFPKPADKIAKARKLMADERFAEARAAVIDVDEPEAAALRAEAEAALVRINLERAVQRFRAGDAAQAQSHVEVAERFHVGGQEALFAAAEAEMQRLRVAEARDAVWDELEDAAARRRKLGDDPGDFARQALSGEGAVRLFFGGDTPFGLPGVELEPRAAEFVPGWLAAPANPEKPTAAEKAAAVEALKAAWPARLHGQVEAAGEPLVRASLALAAKRPELAADALIDSAEDNTPARFELGRAAAALGCHAAAVLALRQAREAAGEAFAVGGLPIRVFGARCLRWAGALGPAWETVSDLDAADRAYDPHLYIALAIETAHLDEADAVLETLSDDDPAGPQLDAALTLRRALAAEVLEHPILTDASKRGSAEFRATAEAVAARLQAEVDAVVAALREIEREEAAPVVDAEG